MLSKRQLEETELLTHVHPKRIKAGQVWAVKDAKGKFNMPFDRRTALLGAASNTAGQI